MANTNTLALRFRNGGIWNIIDGEATHTVKIKEGSTLRLQPGGYEAIGFNDVGEMQVPMEGDEQPSKLAIDALFTGGSHDTDLAKILGQRAASGPYVKVFTMEFIWLDAKGATTGEKASIANCYLPTGQWPNIETGADYDRIKVQMESAEPNFTWSAYSSS